MYILIECIELKNDGKGNKESKFLNILDFSESLSHFDKFNFPDTLLGALGYVIVSRKYRKKFKIIIDTEHVKFINHDKIKKMLRQKKLEDVLSI